MEGMDNTGKTTLLEKLATAFDPPLPLTKSPGPKTTEEAIAWVTKEMNREEPMLYDRHPMISEFVYGPLLRNFNSLATAKGKKLMLEFYLKHPMVIYCRPPESAIFNFGDRDQMEGVIENRKKLLAQYDRIMRTRVMLLTPWYIVYDWTGKSKFASHDVTELVGTINDYLNWRP